MTAHGGCQSAAIGGGSAGTLADAGDGGAVLIVDSVVTANSDSNAGAAGIGGGGDCWCDAGDQGDGDNVTILGNSVVDTCGGDGAAIGRGDDEGKVGTVTLDDHLKVTDLSRNKGVVASTEEREGYRLYRKHVRIEPCNHEGAKYEISKTAHAMMCPHCVGYDVALEHHSFGEEGSCTVCGYHTDQPFFVAPEISAGEQDCVVFWLDVNRMDEPTFKASYMDIEVVEPGKEKLTKRYKLSEYGEAAATRGRTPACRSMACLTMP